MRKVNSALTGEDGTLGKIVAANAEKTSTDPVLLIQTIDAAGNISTGSSAIDDTAFDDGADKGTVIMGVLGAADLAATGHQGAVAMTKRRELMVVDGPHSSLPATHWSPLHGQVTYLGASSLTCTGFDFTVDSAVCNILSLGVVDVNNNLTLYQNGWNGYTIYAAANVLYIIRYGVAVSAFLATDTKYRVTLNYKPVGDDITTDSKKTNEQSPLNAQYVEDSILDAVNTAAGTNYYPSSTGMKMDGYKDMTLTGYIIQGDAVTDTITVEVTNDEDTTDATAWVQIFGYSPRLNALVNSVTTGGVAGTYPFALDFDNISFANYRIKVVTGDSTNTITIKMRRKAL